MSDFDKESIDTLIKSDIKIGWYGDEELLEKGRETQYSIAYIVGSITNDHTLGERPRTFKLENDDYSVIVQDNEKSRIWDKKTNDLIFSQSSFHSVHIDKTNDQDRDFIRQVALISRKQLEDNFDRQQESIKNKRKEIMKTGKIETDFEIEKQLELDHFPLIKEMGDDSRDSVNYIVNSLVNDPDRKNLKVENNDYSIIVQNTGEARVWNKNTNDLIYSQDRNCHTQIDKLNDREKDFLRKLGAISMDETMKKMSDKREAIQSQQKTQPNDQTRADTRQSGRKGR